jgi:hypothetical protein
MFPNLFKVLINIDSNYKFDDENIIKNFIYNIKKYHIDTQNLIVSYFLDNLAKVSTDEIKKMIIEYKKEFEYGTIK